MEGIAIGIGVFFMIALVFAVVSRTKERVRELKEGDIMGTRRFTKELKDIAKGFKQYIKEIGE